MNHESRGLLSPTNYHEEDLIASINFSFRRSAREFWSDTTAQRAAGIQPIKVT